MKFPLTPHQVTKLTVTGVASWGAGVVVKNAIAVTTPADLTTMKKVGVMVGGAAIAGIVGDAASRYSGDIVDQVFDAYEQIKKGVKTNTEETKTEE
jgi:hypothetical protein